MVPLIRSRVVLPFIVVLLAAGCGGSGGPQLRRATAAPLIALAHRISTEGACAQARDIRRLHAGAIAIVNARQVPGALQDPLMSGVNALAAQTPVCLPSVPAPASSPAPPQPNDHHHDHGHGHGKHD